MQLGVRPVLVGRKNSLTSEFRSLHLLQGLGAVADAQGDAPGGAAKPVVLGVQAAPSGTRGMGTPRGREMLLTRSRWGAWPRDAAADTHKQVGRQSTALTGASSCSCHVTKRFRMLATLIQWNESMYSNTSEYVHIGLRLDWGKSITGQ